MSSYSLYSYNKQQFNNDVSFNNNTTLATTTITGVSTHSGRAVFTTDVSLNGPTTITGAATFTAANTIINGNVGIGKTNPGYPLDVSGSIIIRNGGYNTTIGCDSRLTSADTFGTFLNNDKETSGDLRINTNSRNSNVLIENGGLAIGKTTITSGISLDVSGNISSSHRTGNGGNGVNTVISSNNGAFGTIECFNNANIGPSSKLPISIQAYGGNVGIGTTNPAAKLDVVGSINVSGSITGSGSTYFTTTGDSRYTSADGSVMYINNDKVNSGDLRINTTSPNSNVIVEQGKVGIRATNPNTRLEINAELPNTPFSNSWNSNWALTITNNTANNNLGHGISCRPALGFGITSGGSGAAGAAKAVAYISSIAPFGTAGWNDLYIDGNNICFGVNNGIVGIGTNSPNSSLHVERIAQSPLTNRSGYWFNNTTSLTGWSSNFGPDFSIYSAGGIGAKFFAAFSDKRIKTNIVDIDDEKALSILRKIQPKTYGYVDKIQRGNENVIGFIAQEIKEIIPKAVNITKDYIPNFMTLCQISATDASNIVLVTSQIDLFWNPLHDQSGNAFVDADGNACSDASGNKVFKLKLYDQSNNIIDCKTTSILDKRSFLMDVTSSKMIDASGNLQLENNGEYFLHGQEVDDFHNIDKQAIFTVVTAAVQDIDRKQVLDEAKIAELQVKNDALEAKNAALEARLAALEQAVAAL